MTLYLLVSCLKHAITQIYETPQLFILQQGKRNEYQENFLGVNAAGAYGLTTLPPPCAVVMKSGNLNFLKPAGPLQASNGTALLFTTREEHKGYCKNRVMRRKNGPKMEKLRERENSRDIQLQILYYVPGIVRAIRLKWA